MKILLVGAGGYASGYVSELLKNTDPSISLEGIVEPYFSSCPKKEEIEKANVPVYATMEEFYADHSADLALICTPTFLHCSQSIYALSRGSSVLCEKPVSPTASEGEKMLAAEKEYGRFIAIGYQWSFSDAILELKKDVLDGLLGAPISFKTAISWPRNLAYYSRGMGWAGRISKDGITILDSIASNACAHYLHNMLFLLGDTMQRSGDVAALRADCLRANDIESFDTCALKMTADKGTRLYFIASHAANRNRDPEFVYTFENATVTFSQSEGSCITAKFCDGRVKSYGDPFRHQMKKIWDCVHALETGVSPICTVQTALPHVRLIERLHNEAPVLDFPKDEIRFDQERKAFYVEGLFDKMYKAYENELLLSEL